MKNVLPFLLFAAIVTGSASAQYAHGGKHMMLAQASATGQKTGTGTGLIQKIDKEKGSVTIKHGPIQGGLSMGAMTMAFPVKDKAMLGNLQPLQKVDFELTYDGKDYTITKIK